MRNNPRPHPREPLSQVLSADVMNQTRLDVCGLFPTTEGGNKHIMNILCMFSKYVISVPVVDANPLIWPKPCWLAVFRFMERLAFLILIMRLLLVALSFKSSVAFSTLTKDTPFRIIRQRTEG